MVAFVGEGGRVVSSIRPTRDRTVRVLAAEAADPPGHLAGLLEGAGHRVVARAATAEELAHLVGVARPEVVVFDAEMSAVTVAALRASRPAVGVVVVWPEGTAAEAAHEHVSPARARQDLAGAVRRAAPVTAATPPTPTPPLVAVPFAGRSTPIGRGGLELAVAAVLTFLLVVAAIAFHAREDGGTLAAVATTLSPPSSTPATTVRVPPPEAPSAPSQPGTDVAGDALPPQRGSSDPSTSGAGATPAPGGPGPRAPQPAPGDPALVRPVLDAPLIARQAADGATMFAATARECRAATAHLGIAAARPSRRRLLDRCVATDAAGLLRALARVVAHGQGRAEGHRGGSGDARGHLPAAHHHQDAGGEHAGSSGHRGSGRGPRANHRPDGNGSGPAAAAHHGSGSGHVQAGLHHGRS